MSQTVTLAGMRLLELFVGTCPKPLIVAGRDFAILNEVAGEKACGPHRSPSLL